MRGGVKKIQAEVNLDRRFPRAGLVQFALELGHFDPVHCIAAAAALQVTNADSDLVKTTRDEGAEPVNGSLLLAGIARKDSEAPDNAVNGLALVVVENSTDIHVCRLLSVDQIE